MTTRGQNCRPKRRMLHFAFAYCERTQKYCNYLCNLIQGPKQMRKKSKPINTKTPTILYRDNNEYLAIMWIYGVAHGDEGIEYANGSTKEEVRISLVQNADDELKRIYSKYGPNTPIQVAGDMQDTMTRTDIDNKGSTCTRYKMMDNGILKWAIQRSRLKSFGFDHREEGSKYITRRSRKEGGGARGIDHLLVCDLFASFQTWPIMWAKSFAFCMTCLFEKLLRKNLRKTSLTRGCLCMHVHAIRACNSYMYAPDRDAAATQFFSPHVYISCSHIEPILLSTFL